MPLVRMAAKGRRAVAAFVYDAARGSSAVGVEAAR